MNSAKWATIAGTKPRRPRKQGAPDGLFARSRGGGRGSLQRERMLREDPLSRTIYPLRTATWIS